MNLKEAVTLAQHVKKAREVAGMHMDVPYSQLQLVEALIAILDAVGTEPVTRDEHTRITRQLTAANARLAKYEKRP